MSRFAFGDPSVFACDGLKTVGTENPKLGWTTSFELTATVTVKLVPVTEKRKPISPLPVFAVTPLFVTWTMLPVPPVTLVSVSTSWVVTVQLPPPHVGSVKILSGTDAVPV
jgi:hypothetical protein